MSLKFNYIFIGALSVFLLACKGEGTTDSETPLPEPTPQQLLWMEQSWSEYIIKLKPPKKTNTVDNLKTRIKAEAKIIKVKQLGNTELVITLSEKTPYRIVYQKLMKYEFIESIQPNFVYRIPGEKSLSE